ncbi:hydroxylamine reductase [Desulfobacula toluolica]|uniref:Hydroxylamine reductase n=1 Tax=Desulfobacula toluolica (strain DSM 7467 / Tol2) TaxID=651182 RepID=K0NMP4_DESTT|nr:hydroxylamine reductase [Desulfobacula toluolica]CCK79972.1 Hcp: hydroxylamine reductase [Desulfobacula toluolica Tol2]
MFCHQCQETMKNTGCSMKQGMCGKTAEVANLQDLFVWGLKGVSVWGVKAKEFGIYDNEAGFFIDKGLFSTITNANFDREDFIGFIKKGIDIRDRLKDEFLKAYKQKNGTNFSLPVPECATWVPADDKDLLAKADSGAGGWLEIEDEDERSLKALVLYGLKGISAYAEHAYQITKSCREIFEFLMEALATLVDETKSQDDLFALVLKTGEMGVKTMALLDDANTTAYGNPEITQVNIGVGKNPGILVTGHDLVDLEDLLEQTKDQGIDVYTHSEMLPAHYYPKLKQYSHLFGNYGNAWWLQKEEMAKFNGPVLFTSNCLVPTKAAYKDKLFTTGAVGFDGAPHIPDREEGGKKDFSAIIKMAKTCDPPEELETGQITGGFGHNQVMALADKIIEAVKSGAIKRFIVMGGCDGRHKTREYYTQVAKALPKDAVILTAGCAKYKYIKLDLGDIGGIPRVLDAGQCNDCYSLAVIAMELQKAFGLEDISDLPISFDIAWYEQKAVLVLLALLSLGVKGIRLGPTLPGFLSSGIANALVEKFDIKPITTPEEDVAAMMAGN